MTGGPAAPRSGPLGAWDRFVGPGATPLENAGTLVLAALGALGAPAWLRHRRPVSGPAERSAAALLALDVVGGAWTNATPTTRHWYGRPTASRLERIAFPLVHVHPFVAEAASGRCRWRAAGVLYGAMLATSAAVAAAPAPARPPVALAGVLGELAASRASGGSPPGWGWLPAAYLVKLAAHGIPAPARRMRR